jgi:hypothetical protein
MNYKFVLPILTFLVFSEISAGQAFTEKRIFRKTVPVNREMAFELNNKYGTVNITSWSYDSVAIRAEVEASTSNLERLRKMFQGIDVDISETSFLVRAETEFTQNISMLFESFKGMTNKIIPYESRIQINYFISAPEYLDMRIDNKYGDVYLENNTGKFSLSLSNGSFKANSLNDAKGINLTFCDATVNRIRSGNLNTSFSEVEIEESQDLSITSISSRFDLEKTGRLNIESRRDKFFIGNVLTISGDSYFTSFRIDNLGKEINLDTNYGSLNADLVGKTVELITLNSSYTDIELNFDPSLSYNLDIKHLNTFLVLPEKKSRLEEKTLNEDKKEYMTFGTVGSNPGNVKVVINATRGNIYLK